MLELQVGHAVLLDEEARHVEQRERPVRVGRGVPRQLQDAAVVQRHDPDAAQLLRRDRRRPLPRSHGGGRDVSARFGRC